MWRKACPLLTVVLAVALVAAAWRLRDAQTELDQIERLVALREAADAAARSVKPPSATEPAVPAEPELSRDVADESSDMSAEWEQAVPPMDS